MMTPMAAGGSLRLIQSHNGHLSAVEMALCIVECHCHPSHVVGRGLRAINEKTSVLCI